VTCAGKRKVSLHCDIFCKVVDNYGDIGVCWRLARQLAHEHGAAVRLWVDDLASLKRLCPEVNVQSARQHCRGVEVRHWVAHAFRPLPHAFLREQERMDVRPEGGGHAEEITLANLVIEAFACELPERYVQAMAAREHSPVWLNLEYLSAEDWVESCHKLPSPHPRLPLVKYFFFPGFTAKTGGLLLERDLLARRDAFQNDPQAIAAYWQAFGVPQRAVDELRVSLFSYENPALPGLLRAWERGTQPVTCVVPEGRSLAQVIEFFGAQEGKAGDGWQRGNLRVHVLPFVEQERYDLLLWACDVNFVRGEDSFIRAQWAARPFVWHIYPQHDGVHMQKLRAFMALYCEGLPPGAAQALRGLWEAWNNDGINPAEAWNEFQACRSMLRQHSRIWAQALSGNNLALNLLDFFREIGKMRDFGI
jgi:uncharacterized repeat protein (TIGR03837 family)